MGVLISSLRVLIPSPLARSAPERWASWAAPAGPWPWAGWVWPWCTPGWESGKASHPRLCQGHGCLDHHYDPLTPPSHRPSPSPPLACRFSWSCSVFANSSFVKLPDVLFGDAVCPMGPLPGDRNPGHPPSSSSAFVKVIGSSYTRNSFPSFQKPSPKLSLVLKLSAAWYIFLNDLSL